MMLTTTAENSSSVQIKSYHANSGSGLEGLVLKEHEKPEHLGGVLEFYSRRHFAGRLDFGDTVVWHGSDTVIPPISSPGPNVIPGTRHQRQWSLGVSIWF